MIDVEYMRGETLSFGALARPLYVQIGCPKRWVATHQKLADAITLCVIHAMLTDTEAHKARLRLIRGLERHLRNQDLKAEG
jgi:hypothetical protein